MLAAAICLPVPLRRSFDYRVDAALAGRLRRGCRVRVPFGRRTLVGVVVGAPRELPEGADELRDIEGHHRPSSRNIIITIIGLQEHDEILTEVGLDYVGRP